MIRRRLDPFGAAQIGVAVLVAIFLLAPVLLSVLAGVSVNFFKGLESGLTLRWVVDVWALYADTIWLSLLIALTCLLVTLAIGVPAAYALTRSRSRWARMLEEALVLPVAVPGLAIALALILAYGGYRDFRSSWLFILIGHVLYTLPFMVRSVMAVMSRAGLREMEEGAASLGAGFLMRFRTIVLPNALPGVLAGSLMVVTLSIGEFNLTWMLHTPLTKTLPVGLADSYASMRLEIASAYTLIFFVMIMPLLFALQAAARAERRRSMKGDAG